MTDDCPLSFYNLLSLENKYFAEGNWYAGPKVQNFTKIFSLSLYVYMYVCGGAMVTMSYSGKSSREITLQKLDSTSSGKNKIVG